MALRPSRLCNRTRAVIIGSSLLIGALSLCAAGCQRTAPAPSARRQAEPGASAPPPAQLSQQDAAIVMAGAASISALLRVPGIAVQDADLVDAAGYCNTAKFKKDATQALTAMLTRPPSGDLETRAKAWNDMNNHLSDEAKRVHPDLGGKLLRFGQSLGFVYISLVHCPPGGSADERNTKMKLARAVFVSSMGEDVFRDGRGLPLPRKMRKELDAAENTDTGTLEGCQQCAHHLGLLLKMARAVAQRGPAALEQFPG